MLRYLPPAILGALCFGSTSCDRIQKKQQQREALQEIQSSKSEMLDSMKMTDEGLTVDVEKIKQTTQALKNSGDKIGGKLGEAIKIVAGLQEAINEQGQKCIKISEEVAPFFDMEALSKKRDYQAGIAKFKELITVNEAALAAFDGFRPEVKKRLDEIGFTGKDRDDFERGMGKKWNRTSELVKEIRNCDVEFGKLGISLMEGLQKGDDQWGWDADDQSATFQNQTQIDWFQAHMNRLDELGKAQSKAQEDYIRHMKAP